MQFLCGHAGYPWPVFLCSGVPRLRSCARDVYKRQLLQACGINDHFAKDVPTPKELSAILEGVRGGPYEQIINTGMLRCMSKAVYEEKPCLLYTSQYQ